MKKNNKVLVDVKNTIGIIKTEMNLHQKTSLEGIFDHACTFLPLKVLCTISRLDICPYVRTYGISSTVAAWSFNLHLTKLVRSSASYKRRLFFQDIDQPSTRSLQLFFESRSRCCFFLSFFFSKYCIFSFLSPVYNQFENSALVVLGYCVFRFSFAVKIYMGKKC